MSAFETDPFPCADTTVSKTVVRRAHRVRTSWEDRPTGWKRLLAVVALPALGACAESSSLEGQGPSTHVDATSARRAAYVRQQQRHADTRYAVEEAAYSAQSWKATNPRRALTMTFGRAGITVRPRRSRESRDVPWDTHLRLAAWGRGAARQAAPEITQRDADANRVRYTRGPHLREWYLNGPLGVEQGFELRQSPAPAHGGPVVLDIAVHGSLRPVPAEQGIALRGPGGHTRLVYRDLYVRDANGRRVPAHMEVRDGHIRVVVKDGGAPYPLDIDPLIWTEQQEIFAEDGGHDDRFAWDLALDGDTVVFGAPEENHEVDGATPGEEPNVGAAYVFRRREGFWHQRQKLIARDGSARAQFGGAVAIDGDTIAVGAGLEARDTDDDGEVEERVGTVYVFRHDGSGWSQQQKLTADDARKADEFGKSLALQGDMIVVGAGSQRRSVDDDPELEFYVGAAYVFERQGGSWSQTQKLTPNVPQGGSFFGGTVALDGSTLLIGAPTYNHNVSGDSALEASVGTVYEFTRDEGSWSQRRRIFASFDASRGDRFGSSLALEGDTAMVGAPLHAAGAVYAYDRDGEEWSPDNRLMVSDATSGSQFGRRIAVDGRTALIGDYHGNYDVDSDGETEDSVGATYVFTKIGARWKRHRRIQAPDRRRRDRFGSSLALEGDTALIGARHASGRAPDTGKAYAYILDNDGDGIADSNDQCPSSPDTDEDGDGVVDCEDACPTDAQKTAPGACGCSVPDTDNDEDGTPDCHDGCPFDADKTAPGVCGCGVPDTDEDGDGTLDCNDACPDNPDKTRPGVCGCTRPDTDSDGDGRADCNDGCPNDPEAVQASVCGCGAEDADGDGRSDCLDDCPDDPNKTSPGVCGCGTEDTDSDEDGRPDCLDDCPDDPSKTDPGICGCGTDDTDTDGDGRMDCNDECPDDPDKTRPGACGCGTDDTDTDDDGRPDCIDNCTADAGSECATATASSGGGGGCGCVVPSARGDPQDPLSGAATLLALAFVLRRRHGRRAEI